jgi:DNA polymerase-3 subunit gamma/tau
MATQSLYRRYRPRRFSELKGQDHVVRALRDAVRGGREGQAYLFSGPRGTGKTTSARILAKVLNCERPVDGEPCCECDSCLAVERGTSYDVHEMDAASNNGVDAIRDLVEKASLGTPGRHKVYILDEVHMLSRPAEAALLKTLEEPPPHVVFVLATTDPQKMSDTIRSRTQHLQFHLLPPDTLAEHVRWVAADAGLELSDAAFDAVLAQGGGSARDTLSALELVASTGGDADETVDFDEFVAAMVDHEPGRALTAMAHAVSLGRDPRTLTEELVRHLRDSFLSLMAPELVQLPQHRVDQIAASAQRVGAASLVRAIERLGAMLVELRHAPDPRVLVEVALVQLTHETAGGDVAALEARVERLEQAARTAPAAPGGASSPVDPATGRAVLGGRARRAPASPNTGATATATASATSSAASPAPSSGAAAPSPPAPSAPSDAAPSAPSDAAPTVPDVWESSVKPALKPLVRAIYSAGSFTRHDGDAWHFAVPNAAHGDKCEQHRALVEAALTSAIGAPVRIVIGIGAGAGSPADDLADEQPDTPTGRPRGARAGGPGSSTAAGGQGTAPHDSSSDHNDVHSDHTSDEAIDPDELTDAPPEAVLSPIDRLAQAFPGSELVDDAR